MRFGRLEEQMDVRRLTVFVARWLMDGSVPARGRREWAWARRSVAAIRLPVSPKPIERREFSSDTAAALSCPGPDGGAAGSGFSGLFRHPGLPMRRRANGGRASAAISGTGARALARSGRCKWAGLLVAFAGLLALPLQAQAKILVSNVGQVNSGFSSLINDDVAQAFTTGSNSAGYTLKSVEIDIGTFNENATAFTVSVHSNSSGAPGASLGTLSNPASLSRDGVYAFTTRGIALAASTTYFVVIDRVSAISGAQLNINDTDSDAQDSGKAPGWSIGDGSLYRAWNSSGSWTSEGASKKIRVKGYNPKVSNANIEIADASAAENAGHLMFEVTLSRSFQKTVKVDFETISGGTATEGVDYHARRTYTHVILAGDRTAQMGFALIEDTVNDAGETVNVRLSNARVVDAYGNVKRVLDITRAEATGTITAPPASTTNVSNLTIGIRDATGDEDDGWLDAALLALPRQAQAQTTIWTATLTPRATFSGTPVPLGCDNSSTGNKKCSNSNTLSDDFTDDGTSYAVTKFFTRDGVLTFRLNTGATAATQGLTLVIDGEEFVLKEANQINGGKTQWKWNNTTLGWTAGTDVAVSLVVTDAPATGQPTISGGGQVGKTLTAATDDIEDLDGLPTTPTFTYQWMRVDGFTDTDIPGATSETYTLTASDLGKQIKVTVSFTDFRGHAEGPLTSDAYPRNGTVTVVVLPGPCPAVNDWCATMTVADDDGPGVKFGYEFDKAGSLDRQHDRIRRQRNRTSSTVYSVLSHFSA